MQVNKNLTPLALNSDTPEVGQDVYVIGAPKDMSYTMTKGIVSALDRSLVGNKYIQIDASINSGNSGGPLLDEGGNVIGVITLKKSDAEGIGFAVRVEDVNKFINDIPVQEIPEEEEGANTFEKPDFGTLIPHNNMLVLALLVSVLINVALTVVIICLILKKRPKKEKDEYDFEIDIEEL